jgi:hypothetical protein
MKAIRVQAYVYAEAGGLGLLRAIDYRQAAVGPLNRQPFL